MLDKPTQSFHHEDEEKGRQWVTLSEASRRNKCLRRRTIDQNWKAGGSNQGQDPSHLVVIKPKSNKNFPDIGPIQLIIGLGYV